MSSLLSKERITAGSGFNRWLIPPAALAIHLCIGQAYAFSVFKLPLNTMLGKAAGLPGELKGQDWTQPELAWIFTIAIVFLGLSAAVAGWWLEKAGPRKSGLVSACCWSLGFVVSAVGVWLHQLWMLYAGYGVLGGCGLGLGYITPVSTLISWFPDRRGMATGMAIMGFGGGAMIAAPLSNLLMSVYKTPTTTGVPETFLTARRDLLHRHDCSARSSSAYRRRAGRRRVGRRPPKRLPSSRRITSPQRRSRHARLLAPLGRPLSQRHGRHRHPRAGPPP